MTLMLLAWRGCNCSLRPVAIMPKGLAPQMYEAAAPDKGHHDGKNTICFAHQSRLVVWLSVAVSLFAGQVLRRSDAMMRAKLTQHAGNFATSVPGSLQSRWQLKAATRISPACAKREPQAGRTWDDVAVGIIDKFVVGACSCDYCDYCDYLNRIHLCVGGELIICCSPTMSRQGTGDDR
jgi:hypothetical protein